MSTNIRRVLVQLGTGSRSGSRSRCKAATTALGVTLVIGTSFFGATAAPRAAYEPALTKEASKQAVAEQAPHDDLRGLGSVRATGVATLPILIAADRFLATLAPHDDGRLSFPATEAEWLDRLNVHSASKGGLPRHPMTVEQRAAAIALVEASLGSQELACAEGTRKLKVALAHRGLDRLTILGQPSADQPWGWQWTGPELVVNFFVAGSVVVVTPNYLGSEVAGHLALVKP